MAKVIPEVVSQYTEEAAFLWLLRDAAVGAPHYDRPSLVRLDNRVEAHLDGLRVNGDAGWERCQAELKEHPERGETFAAAVLAFESGDQGRIGSVLAAGAAAPANGRALVSALGWLPTSAALARIQPWFRAADPKLRRLAIAAAAIHRSHPGQELERACRDADAGVRARALRAVGELGGTGGASVARGGLTDADPACRFAAAWSLARLQADPAALGALQILVQQGESPKRLLALDLVVRRLPPPQVQRWLDVIRMLPGGERVALQGYGLLGDPAAIPHLLDAMKKPPLARVAGEAFEMMTGVHLSYDKLDGEKPEGFEAGPTENPADENVALDPDEHLFWPDVEKVKGWWSANQSRYSKGTRYLVGKPITPEWLREVLRMGRQRQRAAAALELAVREPTQPLFNVSAPGFRQQAMLNPPSK